MLCEYGCGNEAIYQFGNGKWCCSKNVMSCSVVKKRNLGMTGKKHSLKTINKIKESTKDLVPWNKGKAGVYTKETLKKMRIYRTGKEPWNKGKIGVYTKESLKKMSESSKNIIVSNETKLKMSISHQNRFTTLETKLKLRLSIKKIKIKYPLFTKIEEMRYNPDKPGEQEIQVHCKNHTCKHSKEKGGWFTPIKQRLYERIGCIEKPSGDGESNFYCSDKCKNECPLYGKSVNQLIKEDQIASGIIEDPWYTSQEYQTWKNHIFELDDNKCQWCGKPADHAHHILPQKIYPNLALDPDNGIACCRECHFKYGHRDKKCTTGYLSKLVCDRIVRINNK